MDKFDPPIQTRIQFQTRKFFPVKVCPNCQFEGTMFMEAEDRPSLLLTLKESDCPISWAFDCQFWPQFLLRLIQSVFEPLTHAIVISPAPATLLIKIKLKYRNPLMVNLIPPCFRHATLKRKSLPVLQQIWQSVHLWEWEWWS